MPDENIVNAEAIVNAPAPVAEPPKAEPKTELPNAPSTPESKVVSKELFDKKATEAAELSRQLKARMSDDELAAAVAEEQRMELEALRRKSATRDLEISLIKSGIENSGEIAEMFASGETEKAISALSAAKDEQIAALKKEITTLKQRGAMQPPVGEPNNEFAGKTLSELMMMANQNPAMEQRIASYLATVKKE